MLIYAARLLWSVVFGAIGLFFLWATWRAIQQRQRWLSSGVVIEGEVIALKERTRAASRVAGIVPLAPVVEYTVPGALGQKKRFTSGMAEVPSPYVIGQRVPVRYLAGDPAEVELEAARRSWVFIAATATLGLACLAGAIMPIIQTIREATP